MMYFYALMSISTHSIALYLFESSYIIDVFSFNDETQNDSMLEEESGSDCDSDEEVSDPFNFDRREMKNY